MSDWLFLSKNGADEYINMFAVGSGGTPYNSEFFDYHYDVIVDNRTIVLRGILKYKIMQQCWKDNKTFYYMDSGYLGNNRSSSNPMGNKLWHRIVKNDLQHNEIITRPDDRFKKLNIQLNERRYGSKIIIAAPDEKPCKFYGINQADWITETVTEIKKYTDREIIVRERAPKRADRVLSDPLNKVLANDVHALVTFNSIAAVESIFAGVPAFTLAPTHSAAPVSNSDLSKIDNPYWADSETRYAWASHLAYGQYHIDELKNGTAYRMLNDE